LAPHWCLMQPGSRTVWRITPDREGVSAIAGHLSRGLRVTITKMGRAIIEMRTRPVCNIAEP
ncbi:MAG: hypothetical protein MZV65_22595, partial [Chromatiales bacterium]|nr:hypothetical protein [Chromatiales bacterium]